MTDPIRILDDPEAPAGLHSLLSHARDEGLDAAAIDRVRGGLERAIGPEGVSSAGTSVGGKLMLSIALGGVIVAAGFALSGDQPAPPSGPEAAPSLSTPAEAASSQALPVRESPTPPSEPVEVSPPAEIPATEAQTAERPASRPEARPQQEFQLLLTARRALAHEPKRALRLTKRHARQFPDSALAEERELIAIQALVRLGRAEQAERRGQEFLSAHPGSSHRSAVEAALTEARSTKP